MHKFGITGYKKQEQRVWEQERAIMLGAKVVVAWFVPSGHPALTVQESSKKRWGGGGGGVGTTFLKHEIPCPDPSLTSSLLLRFLFCLVYFL